MGYKKLEAFDKEFTVWCKACGDWARSKASSRAVFAQKAERSGWRWVPGKAGRPGQGGQPGRWLCSACAEKENK